MKIPTAGLFMAKLTPKTAKLAAILLANDSISNYGGLVCGLVGETISISDLQIGIAELDKRGVKVRRVDAGGNPTWMVVE